MFRPPLNLNFRFTSFFTQKDSRDLEARNNFEQLLKRSEKNYFFYIIFIRLMHHDEESSGKTDTMMLGNKES